MARTEDSDDTTVTLDDGQSVSGQDDYLVVDTQNANEIWVYVDDGTAGTVPPQYTLTVETYKGRSITDWMFDSEYTGSTDRSWSLPAPSNQARIDVTNTSGSNGETYRVYVEAIL